MPTIKRKLVSRLTPPGIGISAIVSPRVLHPSRANFTYDPVNADIKDMIEIDAAMINEPLVFRSVSRFVNATIQEGYSIVGLDEKMVEYVKFRINLLEEAMGVTWLMWVRDSLEHLIKYHNLILVKSRTRSNTGTYPRFKNRPYFYASVVNGYWPRHPAIVTPTVQGTKIIEWNVTDYSGGSGKSIKTLSPRDVIFYPLNVGPTEILGQSYIVPAIADIKAFRALEQLCIEIVIRFIAPLVLFKVGTPSSPARPGEVTKIEQTIKDMPTQGFIVSTERLSHEDISQRSGVTDFVGILQEFRNRVLAGLFLNPLDVWGETKGSSSEPASRNEFYRPVKAYQKSFEDVVHLIFRDWFDEIGEDYSDPSKTVRFKAKEVDFDNMIKLENHVSQMFLTGIISHDEARSRVGLEVDQNKKGQYQFDIKGEQDMSAESAKNQIESRDMPKNQYKSKLSPTKGRESIDIIKLLPKMKNKKDINEILKVFESILDLTNNTEYINLNTINDRVNLILSMIGDPDDAN